MNRNSDLDLDRALGEWLADGPSRAPDRPIALALDHARRRPRRRGPLAGLRRDPMPARRPRFGFGAAWAAVAVGLLALALVGALVGGAFRGDPAVVAPFLTPSATPGVTPPATPSPSPSRSPSPSPSPSPAAPFRVALSHALNHVLGVTIEDRSGTLVAAVSGTPGDGVSVPFDQVVVANEPGDTTRVRLTWAGQPCDAEHTLAIDSIGRAMTLVRPACPPPSDSIAFDRILILTFAEPVPAAALTVTLVDGPPRR